MRALGPPKVARRVLVLQGRGVALTWGCKGLGAVPILDISALWRLWLLSSWKRLCVHPL